MSELFLYIRAILYLFSIYNIVSIGIVHFQEKKSIFWIHMSVAVLLFFNLLAIVLVRIFKFGFFETIIFDYGVNIILIILNILVWSRLYYRNATDNAIRDARRFLDKLDLDDIDNTEVTLKNVANSRI